MPLAYQERTTNPRINQATKKINKHRTILERGDLPALSSNDSRGEPMNQDRSSSSPSGDRMGAAAPVLERAAKRRRQNSPDNDDKNTTTNAIKQQTLPPEVWADVMEFLPFDMVLTCGAVSRSFLNDTMPLLITRIRIDKAYQMHRATARRFKDITDIHINSLLVVDIVDVGTIDETAFVDIIDQETTNRFIPFLSCFSALERVYFGAKNSRGEDVEGFASADAYFCEEGDVYPDISAWDAMTRVIGMISAAFDTGALSQHLEIFGLSCPNIRNRLENECRSCAGACRSFPLESVLAFESRGSSVSIARSGRMHGLDVCLQTTKVESIIESRTGGKELLCSDIRFLRLLRSGTCWKLDSVDGTKSELRIVKYTSDQLDEMKRVIEYADLDVKKLSAQNVETAILNSFINGRSTAQNCKLYLSERSLICLRDEIGIEASTMNLFDCNADSMIKWAIPIAQHLVDYFDDDLPFRDENSAILPDYIKLIRQFLELESDAPIGQLARAIPDLARLTIMKYGYGYTPTVEDKIEAVKSLNLFLTKGEKMQKTMVVNAGAACKFCRLLDGVNGDKSIVKDAIIGLANIVDHNRHLIGPVMKEEGAMRKLITLLESSDNICVKSSLQLLAIASSNDHYVQTLLDCGLVSHLCRMVLSMEHYLDCLPIFSVLLRNITESDKFPIEQAIDTIFIEKVSMLLEASTDESVETNLSLVCIKLGLAANEGNIDGLVTGTDLLSTLVRLQSSQVGIVSEKAIDCLERISNIKSSFEGGDKEKLAWGEFRVLEIVDSDEESATEYEEALEVSDEQVALEEQQALGANARIIFYNFPSLNDDYDEREASPNLLGIPRHLLQNILIIATETQVEVNVMATVCKRFRWILDDDDNDFRKRHGWPSKRVVGLRYVGIFQKCTCNQIMEVISSANDGEGEYDVKKLHAFVSNLVAKMNHIGPVASFRLRSDAMLVLFEMCQDYMVKRLEGALSMATHCKRTEVQKQDFTLLPSQAARSACDILEKQHGGVNLSFVCSCALPSSSGIIWRWPDNNCGDMFALDEGRRIIRLLAYQAGIVQMTGQAFEIAQIELLHTLGVLLVEAFEASVESSKNVRHLAPDEDLPYGIFPDSMDMFYVPPPPIPTNVNGQRKETDYYHIDEHLFTIVPGQICNAASQRSIGVTKIYGPTHEVGWFEDFGYEKSLYFKDESGSEDMLVDSDASSAYKSCKDDISDDNSNSIRLGPSPVTSAKPLYNSSRDPIPSVVVVPARPQPIQARNALDALRAHPRFQDLRTRFQNNFASAHHLLREIIGQHPQLRDEIDSNQAAFYNLMSNGDEGSN